MNILTITGLLFFFSFLTQANNLRLFNFICPDYVPDVSSLHIVLDKIERSEYYLSASHDAIPQLATTHHYAIVSVYRQENAIFTHSFHRLNDQEKYSVILFSTGNPKKPILGKILMDTPEEPMIGEAYIRVINIASHFTNNTINALPRFSLHRAFGDENNPYLSEILFSRDLHFGEATSYYAVPSSKPDELGYCFFDSRWPEGITCAPFRVMEGAVVTVIYADYKGGSAQVHVNYLQLQSTEP